MRLAIGVDIGGTRTKIGLVDLEQGVVLDRKIIATETSNGEVFLNTLHQAVTDLLNAAPKMPEEITGIGIGVPGFVFDDGTVDSTYGFLEFMEDYPLRSIIETRLRMACKLDNDARVVALGEALFGAGKGHDRVLVLTLGTGLGIGFTVNGMLPEKSPFAHMAGHLTIADTGGDCYCGKSGCLEALVSATGLCAEAAKITWQDDALPNPLTAENIFKARNNGDSTATSLIEIYKQHLRTGINNYVNIYAPDIIILGGGVALGLQNDLDDLYSPQLLNPYKMYRARLAVSGLSEDAGILGSAALFNTIKDQN